MDITKSLATERREPVDAVKSAHSAQGDSLLDGTANRFKVAFKENFDRLMAAKSGNPPPKSGMVAPARAEGDIELESRSLEGGIKLLLGGKEPSEEAVMAFARAQGFDAEALGVLVQSRMAMAQNDKWSPDRSSLSILKLDTINLQDVLPKLSTLESRIASVPAPTNLLASNMASSMTSEAATLQNQVSEVRVDLTEKSSVETRTATPERAEPEAWRKHDQHMEMSRRLT